MFVLIKSVPFLNVPFQAMHSQIHFCKTCIGFRFFLSVKSYLFGRFLSFIFNKIASLNKHTCTASCRVKGNTMVGFNYVYNCIYKTKRCKKFTTFLCPSHCKFVKEIFINFSKQIAFGFL